MLPTPRALDDERTRFYGDLVPSCIHDAPRRAPETRMKGYEYQSDFAKKYVAQGREEGRQEGHKEGRQEGREEGRKEGECALLLRQMCARFGELPPAAVARVEAAEVAQIEQWGERVLTARTLAEVLGEPS